MNAARAIPHCSQLGHEVMKRDPDWIRARLPFVAVLDYGTDVLELFNCDCGSTIAIEGIGPVLP